MLLAGLFRFLAAFCVLVLAGGSALASSKSSGCEKVIAEALAKTDPNRQYVALWDDFADQLANRPATQDDISTLKQKVARFQTDYDTTNGKGAFDRLKKKQLDGLRGDFDKTKQALDQSKGQGHSFKSFAVRHGSVVRKLAAWEGILLRQDPQKPWVFDVVPVKGLNSVFNDEAMDLKRRFDMRVAYDYEKLLKEDSGGFYDDATNTYFMSPDGMRRGLNTETELHEIRHGYNAALQKLRRNSVLWTEFTPDQGTEIDHGLDIYATGLSSDEYSAYTLTIQGLLAELRKALKLVDGPEREAMMEDVTAGLGFPLDFFAKKSEIVRGKLKEYDDVFKNIESNGLSTWKAEASKDDAGWVLTDPSGKTRVTITRTKAYPDGGADFSYEVKTGNVAFGGPIYAQKADLAQGGTWSTLQGFVDAKDAANLPTSAVTTLRGQVEKLDGILIDAQKRTAPALDAFNKKDWPTLLRLLDGFRI